MVEDEIPAEDDDETRLRAYTVVALEFGGFVVIENAYDDDDTPGPEFAATTLDEALGYIRQQLLPQPADPDVEARLKTMESVWGSWPR